MIPSKWISELFELLKIKSDHFHGRLECAEYLYKKFRDINMTVILDTETQDPIIIAKTPNHSAGNVLFYSHFDVKPAGNIDEWNTNPFEPQIINERIYCRGSGDAKGQVFSLMKGIEKFMSKGLGEKYGISVILDGGEESGSQGLEKVVQKYKDFLNCKLIVLLDSHWVLDAPLIGHGCRGQLSYLIQYRESQFNEPRHAGNYGGIYKGAALQMISTLNDFVNSPMITEHFSSNQLSSAFGPSLTICGIKSGLLERSLIPNTASCHIDVRITDLNIDEISNYIVKFFKDRNFEIKIRQMESAYKSSQYNKYTYAIRSAIKETYGVSPVEYEYIGAYLPMNKLGVLEAPQLIVPLAQADENNHAPNENILVSHIYNGAEIVYKISVNFGDCENG